MVLHFHQRVLLQLGSKGYIHNRAMIPTQVCNTACMMRNVYLYTAIQKYLSVKLTYLHFDIHTE